MFLVASPASLKQAEQHLKAHDPILRVVIDKYGACKIEPHKNYYQELVDSIISQQLSVKAAATIERRFCELFGSESFPLPEAIITKSVEELRTVGLSRAKANYVIDLAKHVLDRKIDFTSLDNLSNEEIAKELTAVKGIGEWTAHMFMMFCMGRLDILPVGDLGIRNGLMKLYGLPVLPDANSIREMAVKYSWHPYESVASWYIWQSLDNSPKSA